MRTTAQIDRETALFLEGAEQNAVDVGQPSGIKWVKPINEDRHLFKFSARFLLAPKKTSVNRP